MSEVTLLSLQIFSYVASGVLGFVIGRLTYQPYARHERQLDGGPGFFKKEEPRRRDVKLDERTFVTSISTDALTGMGGDIGTSTTVEDDVSSSVSRLARLKKTK